MKKILLYSAMAAMVLTGCNEDEFLEEKALDFNSASNSYNTAADFDAAITELYYLTREEYYTTYDRTTDLSKFADMWVTADPLQSNVVADLSPSGAIAKFYWDENYKLIAQANTVISRLPNSNALSADQQKVLEAKARFFRALGYRTLVYLYGDVPLQLEEVTSPKTDYTRESKDVVLKQAVEDLEFAAANLPDIKDVKKGEISKPAAQMLLAETYLAVNNNQGAADAATAVINNSNLKLMTQRFGSQANEDGDVFYDLFRPNNQNAAENTEAVWVIQFETNVDGGGNNTNHFFWNPGSYWAERFFAPQVDKFHIITPDGINIQLFNWPIGDFTGGRGIGTQYATKHLYSEIWEEDFNDMRNSVYNWPRKYKIHMPQNIANYPDLQAAMPDGYFDLENTVLPEGYKMETGYDGGLTPSTELPNRFMCGYSTKATTPYHHPDTQYGNKSIYQLAGTGGKTYADQYFYRLAEAYLLRAEAYVKMNQNDKAAADINVLHERANAKPATADQMSIDYILDERLRELVIEEKRRLTLARLGVVSERIKKYNPYFSAKGSADGKDYDSHFDLFPIPLSAIQANKDGNLTQNPGY